MGKTFIIAEAGVNHNGSLETAKRLVDEAAKAGADAVKFQTWKTELLMTREASQAEYQSMNTGISESQFDMAKRLELSYEDFEKIKSHCDDSGIMFLSTPDEEVSADFLSSLQSIFKIGSGELDNIPFLRHIAKLADRVILSTGMGTLGEIEAALAALEDGGLDRDKVTLLHATTDYPTEYKDVNLMAMQTLKNAFKTEVGYSDHTMGIEVPVAAVALGAKVIEKHFTLDRSMKGPDHKASLEPDELKRMITAIRNIETALGDGIKKPTEREMRNRKIVRKSIVASRRIEAGELFSKDNITLKRVGCGIPAGRWDEIVGQKAQKSYSKDDVI